MDPVSAVGTASAVVSLVGSCAKALFFFATYIRDTIRIDDTVRLLGIDIEHLRNELETIRDAILDATNTGNRGKLWEKLKGAVDECKGTIEDLEKLLHRVESKKIRVLMKFQYDFAASDIDGRRRKISEHSQTFHTLLGLITADGQIRLLQQMQGQSRILNHISQNTLQLVNFLIPTPRPILPPRPILLVTDHHRAPVPVTSAPRNTSNDQNGTHHPLPSPTPTASPAPPRSSRSRRTMSVAEPPRQTFESRAVACVTLGEIERQYVHVTLSPTGSSIVLMTHLTFQVLSIPPRGTSMHTYRDLRPTICCGCNDGRYGSSFETMSPNPRSQPDFRPRYIRAALGDQVLCIAAYSSREEMVVDIHDAGTGLRMKTLTIPGLCWLVKLSPDEKILAVATDSPGCLCTFIVEGASTKPLWVIDRGEKWVNCMAFSPDSLYLSVCNAEGVILTYSLVVDSRDSHSLSVDFQNVPSPISKFNRNVPNKGLNYGIKHLTFSSYRTLLVVARSPKAYPVIVQHVTTSETPSYTQLPPHFKSNICCAEYSPVSMMALLVTRSGSVKIAECTANRTVGASIVTLTNERLDDELVWRYCGLAFSDDGKRGFANDRRKLLVFDFVAKENGAATGPSS